MNYLQQRIQSSVRLAVGEGFPYWHDDLQPSTIEAALQMICEVHQSIIENEKLTRAAKGLPQPRADKRVALALHTIRELRHNVTVDCLDPAEVQAIHIVLLKMLLRATGECTRQYVFMTLDYTNSYNVMENNGVGNLLTMPIHYNRLAPLNHF